MKFIWEKSKRNIVKNKEANSRVVFNRKLHPGKLESEYGVAKSKI